MNVDLQSRHMFEAVINEIIVVVYSGFAPPKGPYLTPEQLVSEQAAFYNCIKSVDRNVDLPTVFQDLRFCSDCRLLLPEVVDREGDDGESFFCDACYTERLWETHYGSGSANPLE